jgi:hypothetical protein
MKKFNSKYANLRGRKIIDAVAGIETTSKPMRP